MMTYLKPIMYHFQAIIFDLDGTLIDSKIDYPRMRQLVAEVLQQYGMNETLQDRRKINRVIRGGAATLREFGYPEEKITVILREMEKVMAYIELKALATIELEPYAEETVKELYERGYKLGIATRSHRDYTIQGLTKFNMIDYFHQIVARDDVELPKPNPHHLLHTINLLKVTPENVLYVGDTTTDFETAEAAGVEFLGYWRDTERAKRLVEAGGKKLIKDLREIVKIANKSTSLDGN